MEAQDADEPSRRLSTENSNLPLLTAEEDEARRSAQVSKQQQTAVLRFNTKPKVGLEYLRGLGLWDGTPEGLAEWIDAALGKGLSKRRIGEFFGGLEPLAGATYAAWLSGCVGAALGPHVPLDSALRELLRRFRLPGEAQCIDRVVQGFARAFKAANDAAEESAWPFSEDAAYVLSFSLVMLNTDLHSAQVRDTARMSRAAFVANNRGIDGGADLPAALLEAAYAGVLAHEVRMDDGDLYESQLLTYMGARKAGWLEKRNALRWRRLWFVLNDGCLYYFAHPADADRAEQPPRAIIPLDQGLEVQRPLGAAPGREFALVSRGAAPADQQSSSSAPAIKSMKHTGRGPAQGTAASITLRARDVDDAQAWADALRAEEEAVPRGDGGVAAARGAAAARRRAARRADGDDATGPVPSAKQENSHTPLCCGWLRKRGGLNTAWKKRYFALFSGVTCTDVEGEVPPADEPVLMYFKDEAKFRGMIGGAGGRPYQGAVRLGAVQEMKRKRGDRGKEAVLALVTADRVWLLAPLRGDAAADLDPWWYALEGACHAAQLGDAARSGAGLPARRSPAHRTPSLKSALAAL
ncbi:Sec7 domain-containing protein [Pelagophyceae sp. CCMP2097]|nr:Sec7 domain-containing protein [Pelagophyceae sp. CCMP2097]